MSNGLGSFNAQNYKPQYGFDTIQAGWNDVSITNTKIVPTKDNSGGMFVITYNGPGGSIDDRFNLWNKSPQAVEIAQKQLTAVCHATGIYQLNFENEGAELRNARLKIFVEPDKNKDGTETGYMTIKKITDVNGNEPGKAPAAAPAPQQAQPMTQQPGGGWAQPTNQQQPTGAPPNGAGNAPAWGNGQPQQQPAANPAPTNAPPWGR